MSNRAESLKSHPLGKTFSECLAQINGLSSSELQQECVHVTSAGKMNIGDEKPQKELHEAAEMRKQCPEALRTSTAGQEVEYLRIQDNARDVEDELKRYFEALRKKLDDLECKALEEVTLFSARKYAELESAKMARQEVCDGARKNYSLTEEATEAMESRTTTVERIFEIKQEISQESTRFSAAADLFHPELLRFVPAIDIAKQFEIFDHRRLMTIDAPDRYQKPLIILAGRSNGLQVLCSETLMTEPTLISGHSNGIASCSVHGNRAVSASKDGSAIVWDVITGKQIIKFSGHTDSLCCVAITSSGNKCVTGSMDCSLQTWDMATGEVHHELRGHVDWVYSCALTPDDRMLVSGSADKTLRVWDMSTGKSVRKLMGHTGSVLCCAIADDGTTVLSGSRDKSAKLWDVMTGKSLFTLSGHDDWVLSCAILKNSIAATGSSDGTIRLWGLATGIVQKVFKGPGSWVNSLLPMEEDCQLLSISEDKRLCIWDVETGDLKRSVSLPCVQKSAAISKAKFFEDKQVVPKSLFSTPEYHLRCGSLCNSFQSVTPPGTPPRVSAGATGIHKLSFSSIATSSSQESTSPTIKHCREMASEPLKQHSLIALVKKKIGHMLPRGLGIAQAGKRTKSYHAAACWNPQQPSIE